jgi:diguanylate cyclase (GGDEF)-like protein
VSASFLGLAAAILSLFFVSIRQIDEDVSERSRQNVIDSTEALASVVGNTMTLVDGLLRSVRHVYEISGTEAVEAFLRKDYLPNNSAAYFAVAPRDGIGFIFGDPTHKTVDLSDRQHFSEQQGAALDRLVIGPPIVGRLSGKQVIPLTRPLHLPDDVLGGMVMAGIEPTLLTSRFFDPVKLGDHGIVSVIGTDGIIRAHGSLRSQGVGVRVSEKSTLWEKLQHSTKGTFWQVSSVDGMMRLYAFEKLPDLPLVVVTGTAEADIRAQAWSRKQPYFLGLTAILCLLAAVFSLVLRQRIADVKVREDRAKLADALAEIERHLHHDSLTGLPYRLLLQDRLALAIEEARRNEERLALLSIGLDGFKAINDTLGHAVGDSLLQDIARRLKVCVRRGDTVGRRGGDEFIVILPGPLTLDDAVGVAQKIIEFLGRTITHDDRQLHIGASVGLAMFPDDGEDMARLTKAAASAMHQAKRTGRNRFQLFDPKAMEASVERLTLEAELRQAVVVGEYELFYQPKIAIETGELLGTEALIRWNSPSRGLVLPERFIPVAEETGLIMEIGAWVLRQACRQTAAWEAEGLGEIAVAINVSANQLHDGRFAEDVSKLLDHYGLAPSRLEIELTESAVMVEPERVADQLLRLRTIGVSVAVDDFGIGYSSLSYLKHLPVNAIKIDRAFVRDVNSDSDNAAIVDAVLRLAGTLELDVIAEGIETEAEERHLRLAGCPVGQGYRYSKPLPADMFAAWLMARRSKMALETTV